MTNIMFKVLNGSEEEYLHSASETVDFTMLTVSGAPTNNTDVVTKKYTSDTFALIGHNHSGVYIPVGEKGAASGVCPLDSNSLISASYLPSYVDDVLEFANYAAFPTVGAAASVVYDTVTFTAVTRGVAGSSIALVFGGSDTVQDVVDAWNTAHPTNTVGFTGQAGSYTPTAGTATLTGGVNTLAETGKIYIAIDTSKSWRFSGTVYAEIIASPGTTDAVTEGSVNLYFKTDRVRATALTGLSAATGGTLSESDTILQAFGKLENRVALDDAKVSYSASTARSDIIASSISSGDTTHAPDGNSVYSALSGKANTSHAHAISDVTGLQTALDNKVAIADQYKSYTNKETGAITVRQFVYISAAGQVKLAQADAAAHCSTKIGIVYDASIDADTAGNITIKKGTRVGGFTGLTDGAKVWLDPTTPGGYTQTCPTTVNQYILQLGEALSDTEIEFDPKTAIKIAS